MLEQIKTDECKYAVVNGFKIRYKTKGSGHPVVFVTGLLGNIEQEEALAGEKARLAEKYTLVYHDSRGRGKSEYGSLDYKKYTWEAQALDLVCLLDHLGFEKAHFVGGSQGAAAILALAIRYPTRASALVLVNPPEVRELDPKYIKGTMEWAEFIEKNGMQVTTDVILSLPPNDTMKKTHPDLIASYDKIMREQDPMVVAAATRGTVQFEPMTAEQLRGVRCPVLILGQRGDGLHPTDIAHFLTTNIPDCDTFIAPTMTYYNENPTVNPTKIMEFFARIDGKK